MSLLVHRCEKLHQHAMHKDISTTHLVEEDEKGKSLTNVRNELGQSAVYGF